MNATIILNNDYEFELFCRDYINNPQIAKDKKVDGIRILNERQGRLVFLRNFRKDKIKRLNISKEEFVKMFKINWSEALQLLLQKNFHLTKREFKEYDKLYKEEEHIELLYEIFMLEENDGYCHLNKFIGATTSKLRERYEWLKQSYTFENSKIIHKYSTNTDIVQADIQKFDSFSKKNHIKKQLGIERFVRNSKLTSSLKELYNHTCQVCGTRLKSTRRYISEAHHIRPYNDTHKGDDCWGNMIVLCPNCHSQFDDLYYAIHPVELRIYCLDIENPFHHKKIKNVSGHNLNKDYLIYTWKMFNEKNLD